MPQRTFQIKGHKDFVEEGDVFTVTVVHRNKNRKIMVKVLPNTGCALGYRCMVVGGEVTKLLHPGLVQCIAPERFQEDRKLPGLRDCKFDF